MDYKGIAFEGGGVLGIAYIGALEEYVKHGGRLKRFTHFAGSSAGSIIAGLMAVRCPLQKMKDVLAGLDFNDFLDDTGGYIRDIERLVDEYGWYNGDVLAQWYRDLVNEITGVEDITLRQIRTHYKTHLFITKVVVEHPRSRLIVMDYKSHPDKMLYEAVRESSSIPLFFKACVDDDGICVDGGLILNYPIKVLYDCLSPERVIGMWLIDDSDVSPKSRPVKNLKEYITSIVNTLRDLTINRGLDDVWGNTIKINTCGMSATQFSLTDEEQTTLLESGKLGMLEYIDNL